MSKRQFKLIIWGLLLLLLLAGAWLAISGAANLLVYFQRGADPASALNIVPNVPPELHVALEWAPDDADSGRVIEPFTRSQIETAYLRAWLQWNLSYLKGVPYGLKTYFSGPALAAVTAAVEQTAADGLSIEQADTTHYLQLHFYSADGSVVAFSDQAVGVAQVIRDKAGELFYAGESRSNYDVVMLLEDGHWRVRHWLRQAAPEAAPLTSAQPCPDCVTLAQGSGGPMLLAAGSALQLAGINYYPQASPWHSFWPRYNPAVIDRDLSRIKGLGLNSIRIFVPYAQSGGPDIEPALLERLADLLDRAAAQKLYVIVTLFDFRADYSLLRWADADRHLEILLTRFADHPAILAWDLKNEPDLDDDRAGPAVVDAWLAHVLAQARRYDPNHLLTIGWSSPAAAQRLADQVDLVQFHYYAPADELESAYATLRAAIPDKPILMGESGLPTWNSIYPHGHSEAEQARYYADLLGVLRGVDSAGYLAWTLYDFAEAPADVAGPWPWQTGPQRHMGVLRSDGTEKPAAALLAPGAPLDVAAVPGWVRWLKPFWLLIGGMGLVGLMLVGWWLKRAGLFRPRQAPLQPWVVKAAQGGPARPVPPERRKRKKKRSRRKR